MDIDGFREQLTTAFRSRLGRNTLALLASNGGSALLAFALSALIGRALGQTGLGVYAAALAWIFPLSLVAEFGLGTLLTRDIAQQPDASHAYLRASVLARLMIGGGLVLSVWLAAPLLSADAQVIAGLQLSSPLIVILPFYGSFTAVMRAAQVMQPIAALNLGMLLAQVALTAAVFVVGGDVLAALAVNTITSAGQLVAAWGVYRVQFYHSGKMRIAVTPLLRQAAPFALAAVLAALGSRLNLILLERFTTTADVGLYAAAARFIEAGRMLPHAFFDALFPLLASLAVTPRRLERVFRWVLAGLVVYGVVFALGMMWLGEGLLTLTYGAGFAAADEILVLLAWGLLALLLKGGRTLYWYARGQEGFVNTVTAVILIVQIGLALWLIPAYGAVGTAGAWLIAEGLAFGLLMMRR